MKRSSSNPLNLLAGFCLQPSFAVLFRYLRTVRRSVNLQARIRASRHSREESGRTARMPGTERMNQTWLRCGTACRTCARARHGPWDPCDPPQPSFTHRLSLNGLNSRFLAWMSAYVSPPECQCDPAL